MPDYAIMWLRRDLRLNDNAALYHALKSGLPVQCIFIFDRAILDLLEDKQDARVQFLHDTLSVLKQQLQSLGSDLKVLYGDARSIWQDLVQDTQLKAIYTNHDFESYAIARDQTVSEMAHKQGISFQTYKDHVIFERLEVCKDDGQAYTVFTPYSKKWKLKLQSKLENDGSSFYLKPYPSEQLLQHLKPGTTMAMPSLADMGFEPSNITIPGVEVAQSLIRDYEAKRNFPAVRGTSRLGLHFRFGTISIREKARKALGLSETYLNELIWRDFYAQILANFPQVAQHAFKPAYDQIEWVNNPADFDAWCAGKTGYPIVDAGMRELAATGFMHNRVRMITASFLTKHLLIDWRWGEAWFAKKLLDFDLASNNGGWQWAAGCGTDAAPYFRIFSPDAQQDKFDKDMKYIKQWVPEFGTSRYVKPIVDHKFARERCLAVYKKALGNAE